MDYNVVKSEILSKLDIALEYGILEIELIGEVNSSGNIRARNP